MQKVKATISLLVIFGVLAFFAVHYIGLPPKMDARPHVGIGQTLAEQSAKLAGVGGRIILVAPDVQVFRYPGAEVQLKALRDSLRKAGLGIAVTNWIKLDPLRPPVVPPGDFASLLRRYGEADVIVSLMGPPTLNSDQKSKLPPKHARVVAICSGDMPKQVSLPTLFSDHLLHAAIVSRPTISPTPPATDDPRQWFDHLYQIVTSKNVGDLAPMARNSIP